MKRKFALCLVLILGNAFACGSGPSSDALENGSSSPAANRQEPLSKGAYGPAVAEARRALTQFGYFPNAALQSEYPMWHPMLPESSGDPASFDEGLERAVQKYQRNSGLTPSGALDSATLLLLKQPRCPVPDVDPSDEGRTDKWALIGAGRRFTKSAITYKFASPTGGLGAFDAPTTQALIRAGIQTWQSSTNLVFSEVGGSTTADFVISYVPLTNAQGRGDAPPSAKLELNVGQTWTRPQLTFVVAHEVGHVIGLHHSSDFVRGITVLPLMAAQPDGANRLQSDDDKIAANALYSDWETLPGLATDIGISIGGAPWIIGTGAREPYKWNGSNWDKHPLGLPAIRIDVDSFGNAWVVTTSNLVYRFNGTNWSIVPGDGHLVDIGIGSTSDQVYGLGTNGFLYRFQTNAWFFVNSPGGSTSVDVDPDGFPWIVAAGGDIMQCANGCGPTPAGGNGKDIGFGGISNMFGTATWGWAIAGDDSIWALDSQPAIPGGPGSDTPEANGWVRTNGLARRIAVGPHGRPWVVNSAGNIFRRKFLLD